MKRRKDSHTSDGIKDANEKLRAENRRLRKQVSQLQKQLTKSHSNQNTIDEWDAFLEEEKPSNSKEFSKVVEDKCVKCKHILTIVPAGIFEIRLCENCGWKKRKMLTVG